MLSDYRHIDLRAMPDTVKNNDLLNKAFDDGLVLQADVTELKQYLLACTEMREADILNPRVIEGRSKRAEFLKFLLQMKEREITHGDLMRRANWTLAVSIGTLLMLALKTLFDIYTP